MKSRAHMNELHKRKQEATDENSLKYDAILTNATGEEMTFFSLNENVGAATSNRAASTRSRHHAVELYCAMHVCTLCACAHEMAIR